MGDHEMERRAAVLEENLCGLYHKLCATTLLGIDEQLGELARFVSEGEKKRSPLEEAILYYHGARKSLDEYTCINHETSCMARSSKLADAENSYLDAIGWFKYHEQCLNWSKQYSKKRAKYAIGSVLVSGLVLLLIYKLFPLPANPALRIGLLCIAAGGVGASTNILMRSYIYPTRREIDVEFNYWYGLKPIMGCIMGVLAFLLAGSFGSNFISATTNNTAKYGTILLAFILGFYERLALEVLDKIRDRISAGVDAMLSGKKRPEKKAAARKD